jgi:hypothetical protein
MTQDPIITLMAHGEEEASVCLSHLQKVVQELELDEEQVDALYQQIEERGLMLTDDCCRDDAPGTSSATRPRKT